MNRNSHERPLSIDKLPDSHKAMPSGRHFVEMEGGVVFELRVSSGTRQLTGTEIMRASIKNMQRGRPSNAIDLRVEKNEIMILLPGQHRKDVNIAEQGYYYHGRVSSRSFRQAVAEIARMYTPEPPTLGPGI